MIGSPTMRSWPDGMRLAGQMQFRFPQFVPTALAQLIPNASPEGLVMMQDLMKYDPQQRPSASQTLQYPFFQVTIFILFCFLSFSFIFIFLFFFIYLLVI